MLIPFVPGIEIGVALMLLLGSHGVILIYLCTLIALALSFLLGRLVPMYCIVRVFDWLHFESCLLYTSDAADE